MLGWIIVIVLLLLILIMPVGVRAAYDGGISLRLKLGPVGVRLLPRKKKRPKPERKKNAKRETSEKPKKSGKPKKKLSLADVRTLAQIALRALHRFRVHLSIDALRLHVVAAASDPYDAVLLYGRVNAGLGVLLPEAHRVLNIRDERISTDVDLESQTLCIESEITATLQIWEILLIVNCAGAALLVWLLRRRKQARADAKAQDRKELE